MNSWVMGGYPNHIERSPQGMSPLHLDADSQNVFSSSFPDQPNASLMGAAASGVTNQFAGSYAGDQQQFVPDHSFMFSGPFDSSVYCPSQSEAPR
jgi:hypothetical protein